MEFLRVGRTQMLRRIVCCRSYGPLFSKMLAAAASPQSSMRRRRLLPIRPSTPIADPDSPNLVLNPSSEVWISPTSCPPFDITSPLPPAPKLSPITFGTPADTSRQRLVKSSTTAMTMMARPNFQERLKKVIERDDAYLRSHLYVPQREENTTTTSSSSSNRRSTHRHADAQPTLERTYATLPVSLLTELFIPYRRLARNNALPTPMPPPCDAHLQQQQQHHHHHREGQDVIPKSKDYMFFF
ncbi:hypothetical protein BX666DRAFT_1553254 [Dichotomocladium elegans]|nr:hypothetical protein BX666DRAFT_1553254 [Dichotomocladium elegans]